MSSQTILLFFCTERQEHTDEAGKLGAAQRFESMHRLLDEAQIQVPTDDFDFSGIPQRTQAQQPRKSQRPKIDPKEMSVFLFPGQGGCLEIPKTALIFSFKMPYLVPCRTIPRRPLPGRITQG